MEKVFSLARRSSDFWIVFLLSIGSIIFPEGVLSQEKEKSRYDESLEALFDNWEMLLSIDPPGDFPALPAADFTFKVGWKDVVNAGSIEVSLNDDGERLRILGKGGTVGAARQVFPYEGEFASVVDKATLKPLLLEQTADRPEEKISYQTEFTETAITTTVLKEPKKPKEDEAKVKPITVKSFHEAALDPLSAGLYVRSQPLEEIGEQYSLLVFSRTGYYLVNFTVKSKGKRNWRDEEVDAIEIDLSGNRVLSRDNLESLPEEFKRASLWVTDDELRLPIEVSAEFDPFGSISCFLEEFTTK